MDASIILAVSKIAVAVVAYTTLAYAAWWLLSGFIVPPRECPQLAALSSAFRAGRKAEILDELRFTARDRDLAYKAALSMVETGELNHLDQRAVEKHAQHLQQFNALAARVVELYGQLNNCDQ